MATFTGPNIIPKEGLVFLVDAGNPKSYPGSGNKWFDIGGTEHYMDLGSSVSFDSSFGGVMQFAKDGNGYARITDAYVNLNVGENTVITFSRKLVANDNGRVVTAYQNNWLLGHHDDTYGDYYAEGWVNNISSPKSDTTWRMFTGTGNTSTDIWQLYINDQLEISNSNGSGGPRGFNINNQYGQTSSAQVSMIACWNRVLTADEVSQVFNGYRNRFGI